MAWSKWEQLISNRQDLILKKKICKIVFLNGLSVKHLISNRQVSSRNYVQLAIVKDVCPILKLEYFALFVERIITPAVWIYGYG